MSQHNQTHQLSVSARAGSRSHGHTAPFPRCPFCAVNKMTARVTKSSGLRECYTTAQRTGCVNSTGTLSLCTESILPAAGASGGGGVPAVPPPSTTSSQWHPAPACRNAACGAMPARQNARCRHVSPKHTLTNPLSQRICLRKDLMWLFHPLV